MPGSSSGILYSSGRTTTVENEIKREQEARKRHQRRHQLYLQLPEISASLTGRINRSGYLAESLPTQSMIDAIYDYDGDQDRIFDHLVQSGKLVKRDPEKVYG